MILTARAGLRGGAGIAILLAAILLGSPPPRAAAEPVSAEWSLVDSLELDEQPRVIRRIDPDPGSYVRERMEGTVLILARLGKDGRVREARVVHSIEPLDSAAVRAAGQWLFSPALKQGKPFAVWVTLPIRFVPDGRNGVSRDAQTRKAQAALTIFNDECAALRELGEIAPSDSDALIRERIIRAYADLGRPPGISKTAWEQMELGLANLGNDDAEHAVEALAGALYQAPWWGEAYRQIARAQELLGRRQDAAASLELCLVAAPHEPDWERLRLRIRSLRTVKP